MKKYVVALAVASLAMSSYILPAPKLTIFMAGDSTMADKQVKAYPETGWGTRFRNFFDSTVVIVNKAQNGRSTKTFIAEGLWQSIETQMKKGDYVLIQFGHNDEVPTKASYTPEKDFKANLELFIKQTRSKGGVPVLITPVARRKFDEAAKVTDTHAVYSAIVKQVATEQKTLFIDLNTESRELLEKFGPEKSKWLFNHLAPGENSNYPDGKVDDTHFNELGARKVAEIVLADLRKLSPELNNRVVRSNWGVK